jgi:16S rRNA (cytidine1402-2'-O)-methyltransferase
MNSARSEPSVATPGTLYVVATPIGNLGDLSTRAKDILASVSVIAAEDTRHTGHLLQSFGIATPLTSLHEHNEAYKSAGLIARLLTGSSIALVSDAGTPLISDPGFDLVAAARQRQVPIVAIPGPCAAIAAASIAGLPTDRFVFEGFLPAKSAARRERLAAVASESRTLIFYEAPHRLAETLDDMTAVLGATRAASVSRELTKRHETTYRASLGELAQLATSDVDMARGEVVIVIEGAPAQDSATLDAQQLLRALLDELPPAQAAKITARLSGKKRAELYELAMQISANKK